MIYKLQNGRNVPIGLQQIVDAANNGDIEQANNLKNQFQLEQAKKIYADNNGESFDISDSNPYTGTISQGPKKLYKNAYDKWTSNTAKGQEFKRFVDGPLSYAVENGLMVATGLGTLNRLNAAAKGIQTVSKVAPLAEDLAYGLGTSYFATKGLQGIKEDIWGKRKFNPVNTTLDVAMISPMVAAAKPIYNGIQNSLKSGNMWMRALRGEPSSRRRVRRLFNNDIAWRDKNDMMDRVSNSIREGEDRYRAAQKDIRDLQTYIDDDLQKSGYLTDFTTAWIARPIITPSHSYEPATKTVTFKNPITQKETVGTLTGVMEQPGLFIRTMIPGRPSGFNMRRYAWTSERIPTYSPIKVRSDGSQVGIMKNDETLTSAIREYRDMVNAKANGKAIVGGSTHSIAEGVHSGKPNDLELYTSPKNLEDVLSEFKVRVIESSPRRIKGTSPYAINNDVDIHTLDPNGPDLEELGSLLSPEEHASKRLQRVSDSFIPFNTDLAKLKKFETTPEEIEAYFLKLRDEPGLLTQLMRKNNLQGIGSTDVAQAKFANRQREMGLQLPLEDLDVTLGQIESQIPGFVTFEKAYPNFDYTNVEGNKAFLKYFSLPESYATDFERMKRLYRQQHAQFSPALREVEGPKSMTELVKMSRKNAQFSDGDASGAGGNMLISANGGGRGGHMKYNTAAQYLPTYHPESIQNGKDYVNAIEKTKLFDREMTPEEHQALSDLLGSDYDIFARNISDVMQNIAKKDLRNPEINPTIQEISKIIDVPRMTGVRYGGTNAVYVGNLSGEPISETFSLGKPFEFGRSFNESLAPRREASSSFDDFESVYSLDDLPLEYMSKTDIEQLKEAINEWKSISSGGKESLIKHGFRHIENNAEALEEIEKLKKVKAPGISWEGLRKTMESINHKINKRYDLGETLKGIGMSSTIIIPTSGAIYGLYRFINGNKKMDELGRYQNYPPFYDSQFKDTYFADAYKNSPYFFPYSYDRYSSDLRVRKAEKAIIKQQDRAWKKWYKENKRAIDADYKARKPIRKELRKKQREWWEQVNNNSQETGE